MVHRQRWPDTLEVYGFAPIFDSGNSMFYNILYASEFDPESSEEQKMFYEFCAHTGWQLACTSAQMQIFYNENENPIPIETEPELEVEDIHASAKKSFIPSYILLFVIGLMGLITFGTLWASNHGLFRDKNDETYEHRGMTFVVHKDEIPLEVEDLLEVDYDGYIKERLLYEREVLWGIDEQDYRSEDADAWGANESYRLYDPVYGEENWYLLCYDDVIVEINFDWEPTAEQMKIAGEKLSF